MKRPIVLIAGIGAAAVLVYLLYSKSKTAASATGGAPINALAARQYALNPGMYNPQGQPPAPTFTPFSGVPVVESLLSAYGGGTTPLQSVDTSQFDFSGSPASSDSTDISMYA